MEETGFRILIELVSKTHMKRNVNKRTIPMEVTPFSFSVLERYAGNRTLL